MFPVLFRLFEMGNRGAVQYRCPPIACILPYVLNPLILLKLIQKLTGGVELNNNNINSKLQ